MLYPAGISRFNGGSLMQPQSSHRRAPRQLAIGVIAALSRSRLGASALPSSRT